MKPIRNPRILARNISTLLALGATAATHAATLVWDGGGVGETDLGIAANWNPDAIPSVALPDLAQWDGTVAGPLALVYTDAAFAGVAGNLGLNLDITATQIDSLNIDTGTNTASFRMNNVTIAAGAGAFSLGNGANTFNITLGGAGGQSHVWTNNSANTAVTGTDVVFGLGGGGTHTFTTSGSGNWTFNGGIGAAGTLLNRTGTGSTQYNGANTITGIRQNGGTITLNGATTASAFSSIGVVAGDVATLNLIGNASFTANNTDFNLGDTVSARGTMNMNSIGTVTIGTLYVGKGPSSVGVLNMNSGTLTNNAGGEWRVGGNNAASNQGYGVVNLSGGTITSGGAFQIGASHVGVFNQTGGTFNGNSWISGARFLVAGATSFGQVNLSGGTFNQNSASAQTLIIAEQGTAVFNISGSASLNSVSTLGVRVTNQASATGTINLLGGTLTARGFLENGGTGTSFMYLNGGTLRPGAATTNFINALDNVVVGPGHANIDTNSFDITIGQVLAAPSGLGVVTIPVLSGGSGYMGQPAVQITGGGGTGATASANVTGGVVTSITITNPGINYTSTPTITLLGGGASAPATLDAALIGASVATGGLNKVGAGTLTLTAANSYFGPTTISNGAIAIGTFPSGATPGPLGASSAAPANLVLDGGTLRYTGGTTTSDRGFSLPTGKTGVLEVTGAASMLTLSGSTAGAGNFSKTGFGILALTNPTGHTGSTNANGGILSLTGTMSGPLVVGAGRINAVHQTVGSLTVPALTLGMTGGMDFDFGVGNDLVSISTPGGLSLGLTGLNLYQAGGATPFTTNGTYTLFDYDTSFAGALGGAFFVANSQPGKVYSITNNLGATTIDLTIGDAVVTEWNVDGSGLWSTGSNWTAGSPNSVGATATFGLVLTTPNAPAAIQVNGPKTVGNIIFNNPNSYSVGGDAITLDSGIGSTQISSLAGSHTLSSPLSLTTLATLNADPGALLTITSAISGSAGISKTGSGFVILTANNSHTTTAVNGGVLQIGSGGTSGTLGSGNVSLGAGGTLSISRSDTYTIPNDISGLGSLEQVGLGTTVLIGNATHTGTTGVTNGSLIVAGTLNGTSGLTVNNGTLTIQGAANATVNGAINVASGPLTTGGMTVNTTGTVTTNSTATYGGATGANGSLTINSGTFTQTGATGIIIGNNGATGSYTQTGGIVTTGTAAQGFQLAVGSAGSSAAATITGGTMNVANEFWISNGASNTATMDISDGTVNVSNWFVVGRLGGSGTLNISGNGAINKGGANNIIIGSIAGTGIVNQTGGQFNATTNNLLIGENNGVTRGPNSIWDISAGTSNVAATTMVGWRSSDATLNLSGTGSITTARLVVGAVTFNATAGGANGFLNMSGGTLTVGNGGDTRIGGDDAASASSQGAMILTGGTATIGGNFQIGAYGIGTLGINGGTLSTGTWPVVGRFPGSTGNMIVADGTFNQTNPATSLIVAEQGTGTLTIANTGTVNTQSLRIGHAAGSNGTVNLDGGLLTSSAVIQTDISTTVAFKFNGGVLRATAGNSNFFNGFTAPGSLTIQAGGAFVDTNSHNVTIAQGLPGAGGLTKQGAGTLSLPGANTYLGATVISGGTLNLTGSLNGTAAVSIQSGGTLAGTGIIAPAASGNVTLLAAGFLSPGNGVGTLGIALSGGGELNIAGASAGSLLWELDTVATSDKVILTGGALNIGAGLLEFGDFNFTALGGLTAPADYVLFDGNTPIVGTLGAGISGPVGSFIGTLQFADGGNDLILHIPEPGSAALLLAGLGLLAARSRRAQPSALK